jgi:hypothetical protein
MADAFHYFGSDLALSASGDLLTADGTDKTTQRILRRLLTNQEDYLWQPGYGAGLPGYIGQAAESGPLSALIKSQMYLESDVAHDPEPQITLQQIPNGISTQIGYVSVETGQTEFLSFDLTP